MISCIEKKIKEGIIPSSPQIVKGTKRELCTLLFCKASKTQLYQNYALHITKDLVHEEKSIFGRKEDRGNYCYNVSSKLKLQNFNFRTVLNNKITYRKGYIREIQPNLLSNWRQHYPFPIDRLKREEQANFKQCIYFRLCSELDFEKYHIVK